MIQKFWPGDIVKLKTGKSPQRVMSILYREDRGIIQLQCMYLTDRDMQMHHRRPRDQEDFELHEMDPKYEYKGIREATEEFASLIKEFQPKFLAGEWTANDNKETEMTQDLYMVKSSEDKILQRFGSKLTVNSQGQYVLEMKGENGKVEAFDVGDLEIVLPYTIQLVSFDGNKGFHLRSKAGVFKVDDILMELSTGTLYRVAAIDTKNRSPREGKIRFVRIAGEILMVGEEN